MPKFLLGTCKECGAIKAGAIEYAGMTEEDWLQSAGEFALCGLEVTEEQRETLQLSACAAWCSTGKKGAVHA